MSLLHVIPVRETPTFDGRYFEGGNHLPVHATEGTMGTSLRANLNIQVKAEEQ